MYDLDYDFIYWELLESFLMFLFALVLASGVVLLVWVVFFRAFRRSVPVSSAKPRR